MERACLAAAVLALASGCFMGGGAARQEQGYTVGASDAASPKELAITREAPGGGPARAQRIAIWSADVLIEVDDVAKAADAAAALARERGGFAESTTISDEKSGSVQLRVPSADLEPALDALGSLGKIKERSVSSYDVTETYLDLENRLKSARELRDRLRDLLAKGKNVTDLVAVETELSRVQSEIESMDGQLTRLKGQVDLATISVRLERRRILGPLGYVAKGIAWTIGKLFVIR
jgi:hypothetical protein